jgi:thioredoxin 2
MPVTNTATPGTSTTRHLTVPCSACKRWNRIDAARMANAPKCGACGTPLGLDHPLRLDDTTFDRVIAESELPVLVDFYADWCGPCRMMAPAVDELARTAQGSALITKLDTDASPRTAGRFQIRGIPTTIVFRDGREAQRQSGALPIAMLRQMLR